MNTFTLKSNDLGGQFLNKQFANGMGFSGENLSPHLQWEHAQKETKSFAITMYDLDAPTGSGFWHWVVFNIPSSINELKEGAGTADNTLMPDGAVQSNTDIGMANYYNYSFRPYHGATGEIQGVIFQAVDVTEQVRSRSKIEENEKQLSIAIAAGELGTFDFFIESNKVLWSEKTKELFGLNPDEEVSYEKYASILYQEDKSTMQRVLSAINENAGSYDIEYRINYKGEQIRWIRSKGIAHFNEQGKPNRFTGVVQDITQRKESEAALKESEHHFRLLAETLPQLVWMTDEKGINKYTSHRWEEYTGVIPHSEKEWAAVVHPDDLEEINAVWMHCLASGDAYKHDVRMRMKSGKFRWFKVNAIPIRNNNNEIENWVAHLPMCIMKKNLRKSWKKM